MERRTTMTLAEALVLYPQLNSEPIQMMEYPLDGYYPSWVVFQFVGDKNYRTKQVDRFDRER